MQTGPATPLNQMPRCGVAKKKKEGKRGRWGFQPEKNTYRAKRPFARTLKRAAVNYKRANSRRQVNALCDNLIKNQQYTPTINVSVSYYYNFKVGVL